MYPNPDVTSLAQMEINEHQWCWLFFYIKMQNMYFCGPTKFPWMSEEAETEPLVWLTALIFTWQKFIDAKVFIKTIKPYLVVGFIGVVLH